MKTRWDPFRKVNERVDRWWRRHVLRHVYTLSGPTLVCGNPERPKARIQVESIQKWRIIQTMAGTFVDIRTSDGKSHSWPDRDDELVEVMKQAAPAKELPWAAE